MRKTEVKICDGKKKVTIKENKISENEELFRKWKGAFDEIPDTKDMSEMVLAGTDFLKKRITEVLPEVTAEDVSNSYPSEIEMLIQAWIEINFFGLKMMAGKIGAILQLMTKTSAYQKK